MIYVVKEHGLDAQYFAVSAYMGKCSNYQNSEDSALQDLFQTTAKDSNGELYAFEQQVLTSPAYAILASYSPEDYPEYFI